MAHCGPTTDSLRRSSKYLGTLSGGNITSKTFAQAWTFDQTGNWANFKQDDNGDGTWDLNQNRTHNLANGIATIQVCLLVEANRHAPSA